MAEILNRTFKEVFMREDITTVPDPPEMNAGSVLASIHFTVKDVKKKIRVETRLGPQARRCHAAVLEGDG